MLWASPKSHKSVVGPFGVGRRRGYFFVCTRAAEIIGYSVAIVAREILKASVLSCCLRPMLSYALFRYRCLIQKTCATFRPAWRCVWREYLLVATGPRPAPASVIGDRYRWQVFDRQAFALSATAATVSTH